MAEKKNTTRKATKFHGTQEYINRDTGEVVPMQVISIEERDANFYKMWLGHVIQALDLLGSQKLSVLIYIMEHLDNNNRFICSQKELAQNAKVSIQTVSRTIKALKDADFLRQERNSVYMINPSCIFKGGKDARLNVLYQYNSIQEQEETEK